MKYINIMNEDKVEIKIQTKTQYYFEFIKNLFFKILKPIFFIAILVSVLYISFYIMLFIVALIMMSYIINAIK